HANRFSDIIISEESISNVLLLENKPSLQPKVADLYLLNIRSTLQKKNFSAELIEMIENSTNKSSNST
ncbi:1283_t:CDS:1, partial [Cetraspora pellucida]